MKKQEDIGRIKKCNSNENVQNIEEDVKQNINDAGNDKKKFKKKLIWVGFTVIILIGIVCFLVLNNNMKKAVEVVSNDIEAGKNRNVSNLVKIKDKYKDKFIINPKTEIMDFTTLGKVQIVYIVADGKGNSEELSFDFNVKDTTPPIIKVKKDLTLEQGEKFDIAKYVSVTDNLDGNIESKNFKTEGKVNTKKEGGYKLKVSVNDSNGNTSNKEIHIKVKKKISVTEVMNGLYGLWIDSAHANQAKQGIINDGSDIILYKYEGGYYEVNTSLSNGGGTMNIKK